MVRITKLTDYGVLIMAFLANSPNNWVQAREIAAQTAIALPTVAKLLKKLAKSRLITSQRGTTGGYHLSCDPQAISIADLVNTLEGPIAITECNLGHEYCVTAAHCSAKTPWLKINQAITQALGSIKLSDFIATTIPSQVLHVTR